MSELVDHFHSIMEGSHLTKLITRHKNQAAMHQSLTPHFEFLAQEMFYVTAFTAMIQMRSFAPMYTP